MAIKYQLLQHHHMPAQEVKYNMKTGRGSIKWVTNAPENYNNNGYACRTYFRWYAMYHDGTRIYFQVKKNRWPMDEYECTVEHLEEGRRVIFRILKDGVPVYKVKFRNTALRLWNFIDMITDDAWWSDEDHNDFLFFVSNVWHDKERQQHFLKSWLPIDINLP